MNKFLIEITNILKKDKRLFSKDDNKLLKGELISLITKDDAKLLSLLASSKEVEKRFFKKIGKITIFQKENFLQLITMNEFLPDSFTAFEVNIGLSNNKKFISAQEDISLVFPHKDCILEGGQKKEDVKRNEIFYNTVLAPDEIDRLSEPKVLTNCKKFDKNGEHKIDNISKSDNLIIKGNNLLALYSLLPNYRNKVKLIYIDPPYNTGNDGFKYNDNFNHSSWLTFMKNRLEIAKLLLSDDGSIWINIDDNESHYLKVLGDGVFGRENFISNIIWHKKNVVQNDAKYFNQNHDHILVFSKKKENWRPNLLERTEEMNARYDNPDNDPRGVWTSVALQAKSGSKKNLYEITFSNGVKWKPVDGTYPRLNKKSIILAYNEGRLWFGKNGKNVPRLKKYLNEVKQGLVPNTIFSNEDSGSTQIAKEELKKLLGKNIFDTPKPEKLLYRILEIGSKKNDLILDFFAGSGTTLAVAHKTGRKYIGVEQMDYIHKLPEARLKKVIKGEQGGISKAVNWKGGGSFVYTELLEWNSEYVRELEGAKTKLAIKKIKAKIEKEQFYKYQIETDKFDNKGFDKLSEKEQKEVLIDMLDMNTLYVNIESISDATFAVSKEDMELNKKFYNQK